MQTFSFNISVRLTWNLRLAVWLTGVGTHTQYCNNDRPSKAIKMSCHKLQCKRECKSIHYILSAAAAKCMFDRMKMLCYYSAKCLCSFDAFIHYVHIQSSTWQLKSHANISGKKVCKQTNLQFSSRLQLKSIKNSIELETIFCRTPATWSSFVTHAILSIT